MFSHIKSEIIEIARNAVLAAESELGSGKGKEKKEMAINYIIKNLPFSNFVKKIIGIFLSKFIDEAIESSVLYLNSLQTKKGE